jgi:hypothetical protein
MKKLTFLFLLLLPVLLLCSTVHGAEWVHCISDAAGNNTYYDEKSIAPVRKGAVKVSVRTDYSIKGKNDFMRNRINRGFDVKAYENLTYSVMIWYINCNKKEHELYSVFEYDKDDGIISTYKAKEIAWQPIQPGSIGDVFYKIVCK